MFRMASRLNIKLSDKSVCKHHLQPWRVLLCRANLGGLNGNRFDAKKATKDFVLGATHASADSHVKESPLRTESRTENMCMWLQHLCEAAAGCELNHAAVLAPAGSLWFGIIFDRRKSPGDMN